jgi:hypothetical protein
MNRKVIYIIIAILIFFGLSAGGYFWLFKTGAELKTADFKVGNSVFHAEMADTLRSRAQGLSGRKNLNETNAMLFKFQIPATYSFWMKDMNFPLDIVWIRDGMIVGISENVPPPSGKFLDLPTYAPPSQVDSVLEINAGLSQKLGLKPGDVAALVQ